MAKQHFLVIGGTRGIGSVLVDQLLLEPDAHVSVFGRRFTKEQQTTSVSRYIVDVTDNITFLNAIDNAVTSNGKVSCVVFLQRYRGGHDNLEEDIAVAVRATKTAIDHMVEKQYFSVVKDSASIVLVSSIADSYVAPEQPLGYHVGKAGLIQLMRYYALVLGPKNIRVNAVSPCVVLKSEAKEFYDSQAWLLNRFQNFIPLGRMGKPEDITGAIKFFASEASAYITGQNMVVDGGLTLRSHESLLRDLREEING